jgi:hypothetical protein
MKKANHIRSFASILVVFLLFFSFISSSFSSLTVYREVRKTVITKKADASSKSDVQLPYTEREKEEETGTEDKSNLFFIYLVSDSVLFTIAESHHYCFYNTPPCCGNATGLPLYLINRTLVI